MHTATPVIEYRAEIPDPLAFVRLFTTTGWDPQGHLTVAAAAEALAPTWYAVSAYARVRFVGTGRIISDGVLHALLADCIVDPAYRHRGIGGIASSMCSSSARAACSPSTSDSASPPGPTTRPGWNWCGGRVT